MRLKWQTLLIPTVLYATAVYAAPPAGRPDLTKAKPIVACRLQTLAIKKPDPNEQLNLMLYTGRPVADPLSNYERTSLGDWPMLAAGERTDPWLRLVLLSRKRPIVIDLAVLINGKSFRDKRDSWIDELVAPPKPADAPTPNKAAKVEKGNNKPEPGGTKPPVKPSESATAKDDRPKTDNEDDGKDEKQDKKAYSGPTSAAQSRHVLTMRDRLTDYLATNKTRVDREEVRWLLASWGAGPGVILLDPSLSWQRSELSPLETCLDQNGDGAFSREEIAQAEATLKRADVDSNDVVDLNEIRRTIDHPAFASAVGGYPLVVVLDASTDVLRLESLMANIYKAKSTASSLQSQPADITLQVNLGNSDQKTPGISVLSLSPELSKATNAASGTENVATVELDGDYVEFSAAQGTAQETDSAATQVAIGAAIDGNPLLRLLDHDNDGRLTRRERQEIGGLFASLDRNGDGTVSTDEVPVPIRLAITLGPHVHELLASPTPAARAAVSRSTAPTAPGWFTSMDKNSDGDLSRGEFLGTTEQFKQLDTNGDGLLSVAEALKLKTGK
jgi:EF hand domain-containing protein